MAVNVTSLIGTDCEKEEKKIIIKCKFFIMILYDPKLSDRDTLLITGSYRMGENIHLEPPLEFFYFPQTYSDKET